MSPIEWELLAFPKKGKPKPTPDVSDETKFRKLRDDVWKLDRGRDRATGKKLLRPRDDGAGDPDRTGEVHHLGPRNVKPEWKFDARRSILLSATNHRLADARGGRRLQIIGDDADRPLTFILHDAKGRELWRYTTTRTPTRG